MLDRDLAELYEVNTSQLTRQVRRNSERFPQDFIFQLTREELKNLKCQIGTSRWGGTRKLPYVFTEQGVAMLSGGPAQQKSDTGKYPDYAGIYTVKTDVINQCRP